MYIIFVDADECLSNPQVCHRNAKCVHVYSNGSYVCQCTQGYIGDGKNCTGIGWFNIYYSGWLLSLSSHSLKNL